MLKVACFYAVFTPLTTIFGNYLVETLGWNDNLVTIMNMACNLVTEYLYDRYFVFGKDKTWDFNFDDSKHKDGNYYYFTRCPLNDFARKYGFLEVLPVCCDIDYITTEYSHGILHRDYTLASGGNICDYWIVPDQIKNPM